MTKEELNCLAHLKNAWNVYVSLEVQHPDDISEFRHKLHDLQRLLAVRHTRRHLPDIFLTHKS